MKQPILLSMNTVWHHDDTLGESYTMCSDMEFPESGWTTTEITATCEFLLAFSGN